ncbi:MAG: rRNA-processing protein bfr2 [Geoglossum umbratile]|nr:MAG: rRNA-processing protein bfr2 [Geoglossum umbratile]
MPLKTKKPRTWAEQFEDLDDPAPREFDPEEHEPLSGTSGNEATSSDDVSEAFDGREHYVAVGKSKLRKPTKIPLGPQYKGSRVSRKALLVDDDSDDPFGSGQSGQDVPDQMDVEDPEDYPETEDSDEGINIGQAFSDPAGPNGPMTGGRSSPGRASRRAISKGSTTSSNGGEDSDSSSGPESEQESALDDEFSGDGSIEGGKEDDMGNSHDEATGAAHNEAFRRKELREMMAQEQKSVVASISQAARSDASKGRAVKAQRDTFDSLLNTRIRLQKGLISANSLLEHNPQENIDSIQNKEAIQAAEEAAIRLWNVLDGLRDDIAKAHANTSKAGSKRKREADITSLEDMWSAMQTHESHSLQVRLTTLEKWSAKVRGPTTLPTNRKLNNTAPQQTITGVLQEHLSNPDRLIKRTKVPRSCAPIQAQKKTPEDEDIFDDADFYQILLKELVNQRMVESSNSQGVAVQWTAARDAKTKKNVDTKASKGRKLRYTVHEKLQNFMAPQEVGTWGQRQIDELFSSLLGQRARLQEDVDSADDEDCFGEEDLKLFRGVA